MSDNPATAPAPGAVPAVAPPAQGAPAGAQPAQGVPPAVAIPPQFHLNPASAMVGTLDFTRSDARKYYAKATKRLDPEELFDCTFEFICCIFLFEPFVLDDDSILLAFHLCFINLQLYSLYKLQCLDRRPNFIRIDARCFNHFFDFLN